MTDCLQRLYYKSFYFCLQGVFSGVAVGFSISLWLVIGSTLHPPSLQTMGVLPTYTDQCPSSNSTVNSSLGMDTPSASMPLPQYQHG